MKKRLLPLLALVFVLMSCSAGTQNAPAVVGYPAATQEAQDAAYEILRAGGTSVGIALVTRDRVVFAGGYGLADVAASVPATGNTMFPIGAEGYAEWRSVKLGGAAMTISITGTKAWRLYDKDFTTLASGGISGMPELPAATGVEFAYLMLFGNAGSIVTVTVP